eukprot:TRINITY_DN10508_c0_g2_i4.p1 TRINITY_DN10508_c0_g2~~TRINITY_DN10508_c0_g2_i4.p1  ORF type:complete len:339 (-),score=13.38 TRINITY_DN10508_c0_g2_i4:92-1108(-)
MCIRDSIYFTITIWGIVFAEDEGNDTEPEELKDPGGYTNEEIDNEGSGCYFSPGCDIFCSLSDRENNGCCLCLEIDRCKDQTYKAECKSKGSPCLSRCKCKEPYVWHKDEGACHCPRGNYEKINFLCLPCPVNTYEENHECNPCPPNEYQPLEGQTNCPCSASNGYMKQEGSHQVCETCYELCSKCEDDPQNCQACFNLPGVIQTSNRCHCNPEGFYLYHNPEFNKDECRQCHPLCSSCYGPSSSECYSCNSFKGAANFHDTVCECSARFYYDNHTEDCRPCNTLCRSCTGPSSHECVGCLDSFEVNGNKSLCVHNCDSLDRHYNDNGVCKRNFYYDY